MAPDWTVLAAGCGDVVALLTTKCRRHAMALQDAEKAYLHCQGRTFPIETSDLIVRNKVDFFPQAARMADEVRCWRCGARPPDPAACRP